MSLTDIKLSRFSEAVASKSKKGKQVRRDPKTGRQVYVNVEDDNDVSSFVKDCVDGITKTVDENKEVSRVETPAPVRTSSVSVEDYQTAISKLRESAEKRSASTVDTRSVTFAPAPASTARAIRYIPTR